jgi:hypothetical protein
MSGPRVGEPRSPNSPDSFGVQATRVLKEFSCILCKQRKIRCDRQAPCSACVRAHAQCVRQSPAPPRRRRKKKDSDLNLEAKIERYEKLLREYRVAVPDPESEGDGDSPTRAQAIESTIESYRNSAAESDKRTKPLRALDIERGKMITENGRSRYFERYATEPNSPRQRKLT